jgi:hypothetical protein
MPESIEAAWLRSLFASGDVPKGYEQRWIAVRGEEIVDSDASLARLMERQSNPSTDTWTIGLGAGLVGKPLYAFVNGEARA